ncbi:hypothetical protein PLESTB_000093200 [Pleodorina starrii]|uniref:Uncharacterized protein n=1 Tax=Pleodorina starrii TaxID=330485 RepID=A0A9W6BA85_9CHLO|nr:hypothetical protein PLESTB_000093200 [Pleodorina starrii]GLC71722.1 hypothetical protein PLESTF_001158900 [Pleodorina starrii]
MTHGSLKPPAGPSAANRQRHSQAGVSSPEGGLFGLLRRPPPQPYHPATGRSSRGGALPSPASAAGAVLPGVRPRRAGGAAVTAAAAATVASVRPSPGAFIRFVLAPVVLLPVAWPWLLLRSAQALTTAVCLLAAAAVDGLILLAEVLRRNRSGAEFLTTWASGWLAWVVVRYWAGLAQLHAGCEDALGRISQILTPMVAAALSRSPAAARVARLFSPVLAAVGRVQAMVYGAYCFVHDEIVPVALDLAERLPLVHGLLHRAVVGGNE